MVSACSNYMIASEKNLVAFATYLVAMYSPACNVGNIMRVGMFRSKVIKGCGMGPWLVHVSFCFRENVVATCKIGSFLCSLDDLLQKNVIVLFFGNQISKWRSFEKRAIFDLLFTCFSHQEKVTKIPSAHISLTYIHIFCSPY